MTDRAPIDENALAVSPSTGLDPEIRQFLSRMMAGYEAAHRTIAEMSADARAGQRELHTALSKLLETQMRIAEEREELISKRHRRDLEAQIAAEKTRMHAELSGDVRALLKLGVKKFAGIPLTGDDSHGLQDLLASMSGEQVETLMATGTVTLTMAQRQSLMSTLNSLAESEAAKTERPAELPPKAAE